LEIGGSTTHTINLKSNLTGESSEKESFKVKVPLKVPPCTTMIVPVEVHEIKFKGKYRLTILAKGKGDAKLRIPWQTDKDVTVYFHEKFTVDVYFDGADKKLIEAAWYAKKAECDDGPCAKKKMVKVFLKDIKIDAYGIGNDWSFDMTIGSNKSDGSKGLVFELQKEQSDGIINIPVNIDITENDPVHDDHGSASGNLTIDLSTKSGSGVVTGTCQAEKRDTGSANFEFQFDWTVE